MRSDTRPSSVGMALETLGHLMLVIAIGVLATCSGCGDDAPSTEPGANGSDPGNGEPAGGGPAGTASDVPSKPPPVPTIPTVELTAELEATCLVKIGHAMPQADLVDFTGQPHPLSKFYGRHLSVVCFWQAGDSRYARTAALDMLEFLTLDVAKPFAERGVEVVGVNVGDPPEVAGKPITESAASFANLRDPQGALFRQVATERLPRFYLLDPQGKVLWFDLEYSEATRASLLRAITVALGDTP